VQSACANVIYYNYETQISISFLVWLEDSLAGGCPIVQWHTLTMRKSGPASSINKIIMYIYVCMASAGEIVSPLIC